MQRLTAGLMFWLLTLTGGALLAPCVILPAWVEYRAAQGQQAAAQERVAALEKENVRLARLIDHQLNDPAFNERQARIEFGLAEPGVETVRVETIRSPDEPEPTADAPPPPDSLVRPELAAFVEKVMTEHPEAHYFLQDNSRRQMMVLGGGLLLIGLMLLGRPPGPALTVERRKTAVRT